MFGEIEFYIYDEHYNYNILNLDYNIEGRYIAATLETPPEYPDVTINSIVLEWDEELFMNITYGVKVSVERLDLDVGENFTYCIDYNITNVSLDKDKNIILEVE